MKRLPYLLCLICDLDGRHRRSGPGRHFSVGIRQPGRSGPGEAAEHVLTPGGAGVDAVPGANLYGRDLTMAYLIGKDLGPYSTFA